MKKTLLTLVVALLAMNVFAANPLKVKSGDKKFFRNAKGGCLLEVIYDADASYDDRMPLTEKRQLSPTRVLLKSTVNATTTCL